MLQGNRVILRPLEKQDLCLLVQWRNDPRVQHSFFSPFLVHPAGQDKWYDELMRDPSRLVLVIDTLEHQSIGMIGLDNIDHVTKQSEMGYLLVDPDQRDNTRILEACFLMTSYAFRQLSMRRIYAITFAERFTQGWFDISGYQKEIVLRQSVYIGGKYHDKIVWGVLREDWMENMFGEAQPR